MGADPVPHDGAGAEVRGDVASLGEFALIAAMTTGLYRGPGVVLGPGDDAAVVNAPGGCVVVCTDLLTQDVHFRLDWSTGRDVGHKAAAANLADIAAMGAVPTALLLGLGVPPALPAAWATELMAGLAAEASCVGASVVGGDVIAADTVTIAVTALGDLQGRGPVTRAGARPGDVLALCGLLGASAAGFALLRHGRGGAHPQVRAAHLRPTPPYAAGPQAAVAGASSMIDVSDGLVADLGHLARASGVAIDIRRAALVPTPELLAAASALRPPVDPVAMMLGGGEDHALVATFGASATLPDGWRVIGAVSAGDPAVTVDGEPTPNGGGWAHFS
ncbi:MAG: thiamine-phosphate kinase [Sporichthyaceae bacterium]